MRRPPLPRGNASLDRRIPSNAETTEALRVLRERYRATSANTVAALRRLAAQLATNPTAPEVLETLRRELHRVHGAAASYGFPEASQLAADLEERAIRWATDPALDRERRASMTEDFANALDAHLGSPAEPSPVPLVPPLPNAAPRIPAAPGAFSSEASEPGAPDIIVVEDDPALVDMLRYALDSGGFSFRHYATGPEALEALLALDTGGRRPIILLDVDLPGLDGFSLYERLRVERPGAYATVFLTGRSGEAEQLRAYRAGAMDYIPKPVNLRILMAKIPSWLDRSRRAG
jgi:CheY-like chemotaxis protein/HPt (histidine-containing phosphotransfer) domain-containing protein